MTSKIDKFRNIHRGASFAILGSSPTINLYRGDQDISIAVNGSIKCGAVTHADYFMCGDKQSPFRGWFKSSLDICDVRIMAPFVAIYDPVVIGDPAERERLQSELEGDEIHQREPGGNILFSPDFESLRDPHGVFDYAETWQERICPEQKRLCRGGTISGVAAQMALVMGSDELHFYGCSFGTPENGSHYGYDNKGEPGEIRKDYPIIMDYILSRIRSEGDVRIISHGFTNLRIPEKLDS